MKSTKGDSENKLSDIRRDFAEAFELETLDYAAGNSDENRRCIILIRETPMSCREWI